MPADIFGNTEAPPGTVAYWDDDPANIPQGWVICDGNNGTENLLDDFHRSIPDGSTAPGSSGGQHSYTLSTGQMPSHDHGGGGTNGAGSHDHTVKTNDHGGYDDWSAGNYEPFQDKSGFSVASGGSHSHSLTIGSAGSGNTIDNRPAHVELVPVMRT